MNRKTGRNDPCPCGSGKKFKKCCMENNHATEAISWQDSEGFHFAGKGKALSQEQLTKMTTKYQENIRNSPLWREMVTEYGKEKAEELLTQFEVKSGK